MVPLVHFIVTVLLWTVYLVKKYLVFASLVNTWAQFWWSAVKKTSHPVCFGCKTSKMDSDSLYFPICITEKVIMLVHHSIFINVTPAVCYMSGRKTVWHVWYDSVIAVFCLWVWKFEYQHPAIESTTHSQSLSRS